MNKIEVEKMITKKISDSCFEVLKEVRKYDRGVRTREYNKGSSESVKEEFRETFPNLLVPCGCPKGAMYENENGQFLVCDKCNGNQHVVNLQLWNWIEDKHKVREKKVVQSFVAHLLSATVIPEYKEAFNSMIWEGLRTYLCQEKEPKNE